MSTPTAVTRLRFKSWPSHPLPHPTSSTLRFSIDQSMLRQVVLTAVKGIRGTQRDILLLALGLICVTLPIGRASSIVVREKFRKTVFSVAQGIAGDTNTKAARFPFGSY